MNNSAEKSSPVVLKFGGSSVAEIKHWKTIVERLKLELEKNRNPVLVLSALKDVSNTLEGILHLAKSGSFKTIVAQLLEKHIHFAAQLNLSIESQLRYYAEQLTKYCQEIHKLQSISPRMHAKVLAIGELMSTTIGHSFICQSGVNATWCDARELLKAESQPDQWHHFTSAICNFDYCPRLANQLFDPINTSKVVVTQGFIASDHQGHTVLLGREGSDTSAAYLAAKLGAKELQIWTDVTGVFSANPAEVSTAKLIETLSYDQARTMAILGAKVLHPKVIRPVANNGISLSVRSTWFPEHSGTQIGSFNNPLDGPLSVMLISNCSMLKIEYLEYSSEQVDQILTHVKELGFDCLLKESKDSIEHIILKYTNTDTPMPALDELAERLKIPPEKISLNGDLLSVVGSNKSLSRLAKVTRSYLQCHDSRIVAQFICQSEGRTSFYSDKPITKALVKELHDKLFAA